MAKQINISEMYIDYCQCMSQREMEKKYDLAYGTIARKCKKITEALLRDNQSVFYKQVEQIKKDVERISEEALRCPHCGQPELFFMDRGAESDE